MIHIGGFPYHGSSFETCAQLVSLLSLNFDDNLIYTIEMVSNFIINKEKVKQPAYVVFFFLKKINFVGSTKMPN